MRAVQMIVVSFFLLLGFTGNVHCEEPENFSEKERVELLKQIDEKIKNSYDNTMNFQAWATTFKIILFAFALGAALCAAWTAAIGSNPVPKPLKIANVFLTTATAVISTYVNSEFNLVNRDAIWERKYLSLQQCEMVLKYLDPNKTIFLLQLGTIWNWGDYSNLSEMTETCGANAGAVGSNPTIGSNVPTRP